MNHVSPFAFDPGRLRAIGEEIDRIADELDAIGPAPPPDELSAGYIRGILKARRLRSDYLGDGLFADPAWDMLLDLMAARLEDRDVSVSSLCLASAVPATTALRWLGVLERRGLVSRERAGQDGRKVFIRLQQGAAEQLDAYFRVVRAAPQAALEL